MQTAEPNHAEPARTIKCLEKFGMFGKIGKQSTSAPSAFVIHL